MILRTVMITIEPRKCRIKFKNVDYDTKQLLKKI